MSTDIEERLRRTYADVAARTAVADPEDAPLVRMHERPDRAWLRPGLAAAATIAVVVAGLMALQRSDDRRAGPVDGPSFTHALPGYLPVSDPGGPETFLALRRIVTDGVPETADTLEYAGDGVELIITTIATTAPLPSAPNTALTDGTPAWIDEGATELVWHPYAGLEASVRLTGSDEAVLRDVADQLIYVDDAAWASATGNAGFIRTVHRDGDPRPGVVAGYDLPTGRPVRVEVGGHLHHGYRIEFDRSGSTASIPNAADGCRATASLLVGGVDDPVVVVVLTDAPRTVAVSVEDAPPRRVEVAMPIPGTRFFIETFEGEPGTSALSWSCREVAS